MEDKREATRKRAIATAKNVAEMLEKDAFSGVICVFIKKGTGTNMIVHEIDTKPADLFLVNWNISKLIDGKLSSQSASIVE